MKKIFSSVSIKGLLKYRWAAPLLPLFSTLALHAAEAPNLNNSALKAEADSSAPKVNGASVTPAVTAVTSSSQAQGTEAPAQDASAVLPSATRVLKEGGKSSWMPIGYGRVVGGGSVSKLFPAPFGVLSGGLGVDPFNCRVPVALNLQLFPEKKSSWDFLGCADLEWKDSKPAFPQAFAMVGYNFLTNASVRGGLGEKAQIRVSGFWNTPINFLEGLVGMPVSGDIGFHVLQKEALAFKDWSFGLSARASIVDWGHLTMAWSLMTGVSASLIGNGSTLWGQELSLANLRSLAMLQLFEGVESSPKKVTTTEENPGSKEEKPAQVENTQAPQLQTNAALEQNQTPSGGAVTAEATNSAPAASVPAAAQNTETAPVTTSSNSTSPQEADSAPAASVPAAAQNTETAPVTTSSSSTSPQEADSAPGANKLEEAQSNQRTGSVTSIGSNNEAAKEAQESESTPSKA